jgi:hypothetical protein
MKPISRIFSRGRAISLSQSWTEITTDAAYLNRCSALSHELILNMIPTCRMADQKCNPTGPNNTPIAMQRRA